MEEHINNILYQKYKQLVQEYEKKKNRKMTQEYENDDLGYSAKSTLTKIKAEEERKLKESKSYKKKTQYNNEQ